MFEVLIYGAMVAMIVGSLAYANWAVTKAFEREAEERDGL